MIIGVWVNCVENDNQVPEIFHWRSIYVMAQWNSKLFLGKISRKSSRHTHNNYCTIRITLDFIFEKWYHDHSWTPNNVLSFIAGLTRTTRSEMLNDHDHVREPAKQPL